MSIKFSTILPLESLKDYKLHLASYDKHDHEPLDVFVRSKEEWEGWQKYRGQRNDFNRRYILALIDFYPEKRENIWLFGGIYEVTARRTRNYDVKLKEKGEELIGRLKIKFKRPGRLRAIRLEKYYDSFIVSEILKTCYDGEEFCGYEKINHSFSTIEHVVRTNKQSWKAPLESVKGVYLITDLSNNKRYVGSACGDSGIWSRWTSYINTGHGGNDDLTKLIQQNGIEYARKNFRFSLLEYMPVKIDDQIILEREEFWKGVLLSRGKYGYNKN